MNKELSAIGIESVYRTKGKHGTCLFHARGQDIALLSDAMLRALEGWRRRAMFSASLHTYGPKGLKLVDDFTVKTDAG